MRQLCDSLREQCKPFEPMFNDLLETSVNANSKCENPTQHDVTLENRDEEAKSLTKKFSKLNSLLLKPIETLYKKYLSAEKPTMVVKKITSDQPGCFVQECLVNLCDDVEKLALAPINKLLDKLTKKVVDLIHAEKAEELMSGIMNQIKVVKTFMDVFEAFVTKWFVIYSIYCIISDNNTCTYNK